VHAWETDRRLRELSERHRLVAQATQHVIYDWDVGGNEVQWNSRMAELFGHAATPGRDEISWWRGQVHPDDRERVWQSLERALHQRELYWTCEYRFRRADNTHAWVFDRGAIVYDASSRPVRMLGVMEDISRDHELESRLALTSRLAAVGSLASGIAHEINNPLAWVSSNLGFALEELKHLARELPNSERCEELEEALDDAQTGAVRIAQIVNDLRTFAHADQERVAPVSIRRVVEAALTIANNELKHRARVVRRLDHTPMVLANEARLGQAVVNLLLNAAWCAGTPGRSPEVVIATSTDGHGRAVIEVIDNGPVLTADVLPRLFDPFYSTRADPDGLGLGLAVTHSIVTQIGGTITVDSETARGTTFRLALPPVAEDLSAVPASSAPVSALPLVFVIDDEPAILTAIERMLSPAYEVRSFRLGQAALDALTDRAPDVILCDVMMPEMSGADLYSRLEQAWPDLTRRVVLLTGGAFTRDAQLFLERCPAPLVDKPFTAKVLRDAVGTIAGKS
jgi:PAS domain S-box-containing protein